MYICHGLDEDLCIFVMVWLEISVYLSWSDKDLCIFVMVWIKICVAKRDPVLLADTMQLSASNSSKYKLSLGSVKLQDTAKSWFL